MTTYTYSEELYSDLHKDAYGFRPREGQWEFWDGMTPDQKQAHWDHLVATSSAEELARIEAERAAVAEFDAKPEEERRALLVAEMKGTNDPDFACYNLGLPYGHLDALNSKMREAVYG